MVAFQTSKPVKHAALLLERVLVDGPVVGHWHLREVVVWLRAQFYILAELTDEEHLSESSTLLLIVPARRTATQLEQINRMIHHALAKVDRTGSTSGRDRLRLLVQYLLTGWHLAD